MNIFLLSLAIIVIGGLLPLLNHQEFNLMKVRYIAVTIGGCMMGLCSIVPQLFSTSTVHFSVTWLKVFTLSLTLDSLSAFFLIPIFIVCPLTVLYTFHYLEKQEQSGWTGVNFLFLNLLIVTMALVTVADNIYSFALAWELMSLTSFVLVMFEFHKAQTRKAGYIYFIFAQAGALCLFAGFAIAYTMTDSTNFSSFSAMPETIKLVVFFLVFVGFGSKAGIFPLHIWLPHAHPAAPSHISAIMSGVMIKMGIYGILRFYFTLDLSSIVAGQVVLVIGMISGILGVVYALGEDDLKRLLAYCSAENIGIILIGAGVGMIGVATDNHIMALAGFSGSILHVLNHSIFKSLLFLGAGAVLKKTGLRHIDELGGLMKRMPTTGKNFLAGSIAISGLPPFNGFISEFLIYYGAFNGLPSSNGSIFIFSMLAILSLAFIGGLAAGCFSKVVGIVFLGEPRTAKAANCSEAGFTVTLPMTILSIACILIGIFPSYFVHLAQQAFAPLSFMSGVDSAQLDTIIGNIGFTAKIFVFFFVCIYFLRKRLYLKKDVTSSSTWGCGFTQASARVQYTGTSYAMSMVEFFKPFVLIKTSYTGIRRIFPGKTTYATHVDDIAETGLTDYIVSPALYLLGKFRWIQHGHIQLYIAYIIITIIVLLLFI